MNDHLCVCVWLVRFFGTARIWQPRSFFFLAMLAALFSVAAPSGPLRAGNAPSAVLSVLPTSSVLAQPGEEPEVLSESKRRAAENRKAVEERRKEHEKRVAER